MRSTRPSRMWTTRSAARATSAAWVASSSVSPRSRLSRTSASRMRAPVAESRLPVGSSAMTSTGSCTTARAMAARCISPPDNCVGLWSSRCPSPSSVAQCRALSNEAARALPASSSGSAMFSTRLSVGSRLKNWNTNPSRSRRTRVSPSSASVSRRDPSSQTRPALGRSIAPHTCSSVDLPHPEGPTMATNSPRATSRLTSETAATAASPAR